MRTSCSTKRMVMCEGMGTSRIAMWRSKVDFPTPLRPMRPYRRPCASVREAPDLWRLSRY